MVMEEVGTVYTIYSQGQDIYSAAVPSALCQQSGDMQGLWLRLAAWEIALQTASSSHPPHPQQYVPNPLKPFTKLSTRVVILMLLVGLKH